MLQHITVVHDYMQPFIETFTLCMDNFRYFKAYI